MRIIENAILIITSYIIFVIVVSLSSISYFLDNWKIFHIFNPVRNYNTYTQFNWFGIIIITLFLNIIFIPYAIVYWIYKLFTVGRNEK